MRSTTLVIWECPPLSARISLRQCERNRRVAQEEPNPAAMLDDVDWPRPSALLRPCLTCQGLTWWAERTGRGPQQLQVQVTEPKRPAERERSARAWHAARGWHRPPASLRVCRNDRTAGARKPRTAVARVAEESSAPPSAGAAGTRLA
jgi:hypothetical protein